MLCPNCQHIAQDNGSDRMPGVCPACGIAYRKWRDEHKKTDIHRLKPVEPVDEEVGQTPLNWYQRLYYFACFMPSDRDESAFWGHSMLYIGFVCWGWVYILGGLDTASINASFLHIPDSVLHDFGKVIFSAFGEVTTLLPGSTFQILFPFSLLLGFMIIQRDNFAASILLWWNGQNIIDVSSLMVMAQGNTGFAAMLCFSIGAIVIVLSQCWGGYLLYVEFCGRTGISLIDEPEN